MQINKKTLQIIILEYTPPVIDRSFKTHSLLLQTNFQRNTDFSLLMKGPHFNIRLLTVMES